jgi:VanZ family protein
MTRSSPTPNKRKIAPHSWVFLGLHLFFATLIIVECSLNASVSGDQSTWLAEVVRSIANWINQSPTVKTITPKSFTVSPDERVSGANGLVLGKTKYLSYTLAYEASSNVVYNSSISYERKDGSTSSDYQVLVSSNTQGGAFRIVPLKVGSFEVDFLSATAGLHYDYAFNVSERLTPTSFTFDTSAVTLGLHQGLDLAPTLTSDDSFDTWNETLDHYLQRYYDPDKISWVSSNPSVASVDSRGVVHALSVGTSVISPTLFPSLTKTITVDSAQSLLAPASLELSASAATIHPGDFSYWSGAARYGIQLTATLRDGGGSSSGVDQGVHFVSSDPLVAMVSNPHIDSDTSAVPAGFVQGYDLKGEATITAISNADPSVQATIKLTSSDEVPTAVNWTYRLNGVSQTLASSYSVTAGDSFTVQAAFEPKNTTDQSLNVVSSDPSVLAVYSNGTSAPSFGFLKAGSARVDIASTANPNLKTSISFTVAAAPYIPASDVSPLSYKVRKIGHFLCYAGSALFLLLFLFTAFRRDHGYFFLSIGTSLTEGFLLACLGEGIQLFIPKRTASWWDIGIDFSGVALGVLIVALIFFLIDLHSKKKAPVEPSIEPKKKD